MTNHLSARRGVFLSMAAVLALTPFNMGGCSDVTTQIGSAVGGHTGQVISAGGRAGEKAGKTELLNESDERAMGESVAMTITTRHPIVKDERLNEYVTLVGLTLVNSSSRPDANWLFAVVETDEVNAYSGPGGYILVTRGAIRQMHDESELAGVLAHEMTHILNKHGLNAVKRAGELNFAKEIGETLTGDARTKAMFSQATRGLIDQVLVKGYSQNDENEADAGAVDLLIAAGYDPSGFQRFIGRLAQQPGQRSVAFSTHPGAAERAAKIQKRIADRGKGPGGAVLQARFQSMTQKTAS